MQHRGEIIEKAVRESGLSISELARRMKKSRRTIYNLFENPNVSIDEVLHIGKIIHHDFNYVYTDMSKNISTVGEPEATYGETTAYWKDRYIKLLEKYNALLERVKEV
jgi:predicted transcriptional regulator